VFISIDLDIDVRNANQGMLLFVSLTCKVELSVLMCFSKAFMSNLSLCELYMYVYEPKRNYFQDLSAGDDFK